MLAYPLAFCTRNQWRSKPTSILTGPGSSELRNISHACGQPLLVRPQPSCIFYLSAIWRRWNSALYGVRTDTPRTEAEKDGKGCDGEDRVPGFRGPLMNLYRLSDILNAVIISTIYFIISHISLRLPICLRQVF
jgi:hypothetical protein